MFSKLERIVSDWNSTNKPFEAKIDVYEMATDFHDIDKASIAPAVVRIDFYLDGKRVRDLYVHVRKQNLEGTENKYRNTGIALNSSIEIIKRRISESRCIAESLEEAAIIFFNKTVDIFTSKDHAVEGLLKIRNLADTELLVPPSTRLEQINNLCISGKIKKLSMKKQQSSSELYFETHISNSLFEVRKQVPALLEAYHSSKLTILQRKIIYEAMLEVEKQIALMSPWRE